MKNLSKIYIFNFFCRFLVVIPVIVPFFSSLGLNMTQIYKLQAIYGLSVMLFEIPTGYVGDYWGRKQSLCLGTFIAACSFSLLLFSKSYNDLLLYEIIFAFGHSFISGTDIAIVYDSIEDKSTRLNGTHALANMQFSLVLGESTAAIIGGLLAAHSYGYVLHAQAAVGWIPFFIAIGLCEPDYDKLQSSNHKQNFMQVIRHLLKSDRVLQLTFINLVAWGLAVFFAVWMFQKYWQQHDIPMTYFGFIWAAYNISVGIIGKQVHWLEKKMGPIPLLIFLGIVPVLAYFSMSLSLGFAGVFVGILFYFSRGITNVLLRDALNWRTPSKFRSTANSLQSFCFRLGFAAFGPIIGFLIDHKGMSFTMLSLGCAYFVVFLLFLLPLVRAVRQLAPAYIPEGN